MTGQRKSVLLVEDGDDHAELVLRAFEPHANEFDITVASDLSQARGALDNSSFDLLIVDLVLPDGRGTELLEHDGKSGSVPVLIVTSHGDEHVAVEALKKGALDYVVKADSPFGDMPRIARSALRQWEQMVAHREAEQKLRLLSHAIANSLDGVVITDLDGRITFCNKATTTLYGYQFDDLLGRHVDELAASTRHSSSEFMPGKRGADGWAGELELLKKTGERFTASVTTSNVMDDNGNPVGKLGVVRDITQRRQAEEALRASELRYRTVVEASGEAIISLTPQAVVKMWNPAAERIFGYAAQEMEGASIVKLEPNEKKGELNRVFAKAGDGEPIAGFETQTITKAGLLIDTIVNVRPIVDDSGQVTGIVATLCDVTDFKQVQEQLRRRDADLAHVTRVSTMGEMATVLAHEVNQPMTAIANYASTTADLLEQEKMNREQVRETHAKISRQAHRAGEIINRLKRFVSRAAPRLSRIDLNELVLEAYALMNSQIQVCEATVELNLADSLPSLRADSLQIQQVLINLIQNALESMDQTDRAERKIVISTAAGQDSVTATIADCGRGIAPEVVDRLFEPYFTTKSRGLGMGLKISQRIIQAHNGRLWISENPDRGTTVHLSLPAE